MKKTFLWAIFALSVGCFIAAQSGLLFAEKGEKGDVREESIEGSTAVPSEEAQLASLAKVSLVEAIQAAVKNTPGKAISAELEEDDGYLVYSVDVVTGDKVMEVKVDAGDKKILKTEVQNEDENGEDEKSEGEKCGHGKGGKHGGEEDE